MSQGVKSGKSVYFYPRPPRGGRQVRHTSLTGNGHISIHALREEGDLLKMTFLSPLQISIHALREEGDSPAFCGEGSALVFLSTPSARRATSEIAKSNISVLFLSTPSARRATPASRCTFHPTAHFYPRPPRGGRPFWAETVEYTTPFLSTPSARRATHFKRTSARHNAISIHALREEGDFSPMNRFQFFHNFYPRPPRGGRQQKQRQNLYFLINYTTFCTNLEEP